MTPDAPHPDQEVELTEQTSATPTAVRNATDLSRFEITVDGQVAGFLEYHFRGGVIVFDHTEIHDDFRGLGLAGQLAAGALDAVRERGLQIRPVCEYLAGYVRRNPGYAALLEPRARPVP